MKIENIISVGLKKLIETNAIGLASIGKNGRPHNIAVACVKVVEDKVIISNTHIKETIKNLKHNNNVALVVWNREWEKACVGFELVGKAKHYTEGKWFEYVKNLQDNEGYNVVGAIVVKITKIKRLIS
jgi:uncharacterized pyridoxamine 5'-phosphate oxidase family protein